MYLLVTELPLAVSLTSAPRTAHVLVLQQICLVIGGYQLLIGVCLIEVVIPLSLVIEASFEEVRVAPALEVAAA